MTCEQPELAKFKEAALKLECDHDTERFREHVSKLVKHKLANRWTALAVSALVGTAVATIATLSLAFLIFFARLALPAPAVMDWLFGFAFLAVAVATFVIAFRDTRQRLTDWGV